jgi:hypothetical protein
MNHRKGRRKGRRFDELQPMLAPDRPDLPARIRYVHGIFEPVDPADREAQNLIDFLLWNDPDLAGERERHVARIRDLIEPCRVPWEVLAEYATNLSFATALEAELGVPIP